MHEWRSACEFANHLRCFPNRDTVLAAKVKHMPLARRLRSTKQERCDYVVYTDVIAALLTIAEDADGPASRGRTQELIDNPVSASASRLERPVRVRKANDAVAQSVRFPQRVQVAFHRDLMSGVDALRG